MANDREVLRIIWEGQIPVCFQADTDEVNGVRQPENFYLMISRLSYLPLVTDKVRQFINLFLFSSVWNCANRHQVTNQWSRQWANFDVRVYVLALFWQVKKHFSRFVSNEAQEGEVWFDCNGIPLKWHYPIGESSHLHNSGTSNRIVNILSVCLSLNW